MHPDTGTNAFISVWVAGGRETTHLFPKVKDRTQGISFEIHAENYFVPPSTQAMNCLKLYQEPSH